MSVKRTEWYQASLGSPVVGSQPWLLVSYLDGSNAQSTTLTVWLSVQLLSCIQPAVDTDEGGGR